MNEPMDAGTDALLVSKAKKGDLEAFTELVRSSQERVFNTIVSFTHNVQDADDIMQETYWQAYKNLGRFKGESTFFTWVYRIAVNRTLNHLKKMRFEKARVDLDPTLAVRAENPSTRSPESDSLRSELSRKMQEAIDGLPLIYRAAFNLVARQGLSHAEAARILNVSENTISWRMHRARRMLREKLRPYLQGGES
jgi:RNA polymerase sigma-70 factor (ECF subfamily)